MSNALSALHLKPVALFHAYPEFAAPIATYLHNAMTVCNLIIALPISSIIISSIIARSCVWGIP